MTTGNSLSSDVLEKVFEKGAATAPAIERPDGGKEVLLPEGYRAHTIPPLEAKLSRIRQSVTMYDAPSFADYVNKFKTPTTRIFALPGHLSKSGKAVVNAVIDYHGQSEGEAAGKPEYAAHIANYAPRYSVQWERWNNAGAMQQDKFAEFIEENRDDIREPDAAVLLDLVTKFKATKKIEYNSVTHQPNGDVTIGWAENTEHHGKPGVTMPPTLTLGIPVFFKGKLYEVTALLRYRLADAKLTFVIKVDRPDIIEQAAFDEITKALQETTSIEPYLGMLGTGS